MSKKHGAGSPGLLRELKLIRRQAGKVWHLVPARHKAAFLAAAAVMAFASLCNVAVPIFLGQLVNQVKNATHDHWPAHQLYSAALLYLSLIAGAYVLRELLQVFRRYLVENACTRLEKVFTVKVVSHLLKADLSHVGGEKVGSLHGRIGRSVVGFIRMLRLAFLDFFPPLVSGAFAIVAALTRQPWLALAMVGVIPVSLYLTVRQLASQRGVRLSLLRTREEMDGTVVEQLGGIDYIRAANTEQHEVERVAHAAEKRRAREIKHHVQMSVFGCLKALNEGVFQILVIALALYLAVQGRIEFGDILTFSLLFGSVMAPLNEVHRGLDEGHECSLQVADLLEMLALPSDRSFSPALTKEPNLRERKVGIEARNLSVEYVTADGRTRKALDDVSLTVTHGETLGVVGPSGSGKTTWLRVLMRLIHANAGEMIVGGVTLDSVSRESIGRLIGYVGQSPFVFSGTIAENVAYGTKGATQEEIERSARRAAIHDEIMAMPGGYEAKVAERGQNLSGGQRQRLALARVFLKNPPILILDEGTSALDTISERTVQRAIEAAREDRTVILVAHRLSTLVDADRIVVFNHGKIVEEGTYDDLLQRDGLFAELARAAAQGVEVAPSPAAVA